MDREIDEQGALPYKFLTVPYSKHFELAPPTTPSAPAASGSTNAATAATDDSSSGAIASAALSEEQQAAHSLAPYVLSPAQLHLWDYPPLLLVTETMKSASVIVSDSVVESEDAQPSKRARLDPESTGNVAVEITSVIKGVFHGAEYVPAISEAQHTLSQLGYTSWVTTNSLGAVGSTTIHSPAISPVLVAAIDCEMCDTAQGSELTRISVLSFEGALLLDTLVKPKNEITNYQTQYSGITEEMLRDVTVTLEQVQTRVPMYFCCPHNNASCKLHGSVNNVISRWLNPSSFSHFFQVQIALLRLFSSSTILIGHSLDSDLRALRLVHSKCVDTALIYPHPRGFPMRLKLKKLAEDYLQLRIQNNTAKGTLFVHSCIILKKGCLYLSANNTRIKKIVFVLIVFAK